MRTACVRIDGVTTLGFSGYLVSERGDQEGFEAFEQRVWMERCHVTDDGRCFVPAMALKLMFEEAASRLGIKIPGRGNSTFKKRFVQGIVPNGDLIVGRKEDVKPYPLKVPSDGKKGGGKRVRKIFPILEKWGGEVDFTILDDLIDREIFQKHLEEAGKYNGLGFWRAQVGGLWGRFEAKVLKWK